MKLFILISFLLPLFTNGQSIIARAPEQQNVYLHIRNPIVYKIRYRNNQDLSFQTSNGSLEFIHDTLFVTPNSYQPTIISVFVKGKDSLIEKLSFKTADIGIPKLRLKPIMGAPHEIIDYGIRWGSEQYLKLDFPINLSYLKLDTCSRIISFKITFTDEKGSYNETFVSHSDTIPSTFTQKWNSLQIKESREQPLSYIVKVHEILIYASWVSSEPFYINDYTVHWEFY
jgi:hypothetical protein